MDRLSAYSLLANSGSRGPFPCRRLFGNVLRNQDPSGARDRLLAVSWRQENRKRPQGRLARIALAGRRSRTGDRGGQARKQPARPRDRVHRSGIEDAAKTPPAAGGGERIREMGRPGGRVAESGRHKAGRARGSITAALGVSANQIAMRLPSIRRGQSRRAHRSVHRGQTKSRRCAGRPTRGPANLDPPCHIRPARLTADSGGGRRFRARHFARRFRTGRRPAARVAALWRTAGAGTGWMSFITPILPVTTPIIRSRKAIRYRDYIIDSFNRDKPFDLVCPRAIGR